MIHYLHSDYNQDYNANSNDKFECTELLHGSIDYEFEDMNDGRSLFFTLFRVPNAIKCWKQNRKSQYHTKS